MPEVSITENVSLVHVGPFTWVRIKAHDGEPEQYMTAFGLSGKEMLELFPHLGESDDVPPHVIYTVTNIPAEPIVSAVVTMGFMEQVFRAVTGLHLTRIGVQPTESFWSPVAEA